MLIKECVQELNTLEGNNEVTLMGVPGHQGISGNEIVDELAKRGTLEDPSEQLVGVPFAKSGNGWIRNTNSLGAQERGFIKPNFL